MIVLYKSHKAEILETIGAGLYEIRILNTNQTEIVSEEFIILIY